MRNLAFLLVWVGGLISSNYTLAQQAFSGVFQQSNTAHVYLYQIPWEELISKNTELARDGFQLSDLEAVNQNGKVAYWAIWQETGEGARVERAGGWENMIKLKQRLADEGFLLVDIEGYVNEQGGQEFSGVWIKGNAKHKLWKLDTWEGLVENTKAQSGQYFQMVDVEAFTDEWGATSYLAVYHQLSPSQRAHLFMSDDPGEFSRDLTMRMKSGYRLFDYETFENNGQVFLAGLYKKSEINTEYRHRVEWESFANYQIFLGESYHLTDIEISAGTGKVTAPPFQTSRLEQTPDLPQSVVGTTRSGSPGRINQTAPAAATNSLIWLSRNGFPRLSSEEPDAPGILARKLSGSRYFNSLGRQVNAGDIINGLTLYLEDQNYQIEAVKLQDVRSFDHNDAVPNSIRNKLKIEAGVNHPTLEFAQEGLLGSSIVLLEWVVYEPFPGDSLNQKFISSGSYWATLVGYGVNEHEVENPDVLIVHSPAHGGKEPLYLRVEELDNRIVLHPDSELIDSDRQDDPSILAGQQRYLRNALNNEGNRFAVWERTIVVKLKEPSLAKAD